MSNLEKKIIIHALIQLLGEEILTAQQRWDLLAQVIFAMCGENLTEIIKQSDSNYKLLLKRGTQAENDEYIGCSGELTLDQTNNLLRVHDGVTAGGHIVGGGAVGDDDFADTDLSNLTDAGISVMAGIRNLNWDQKIDYTSADRITVPADGFIFCRGATRSMDWMNNDFTTTVMDEYILSNNYTTVWAPVFAGQCLKNRSVSQYQQVYFIPYANTVTAD